MKKIKKSAANRERVSNFFGAAKKWMEALALLICSIVGVGFVSGAEIYEFFVRFGEFKFVGIAFVFIFTFLLIYKILRNLQKAKNCKSIQILSKNDIKTIEINKKTVRSLLIFLCTCLVCGAMVSGLRVLSFGLFNKEGIILVVVVLLLAGLLLFLGLSSISKFDYLVLVFLFILSIYFTFSKFSNQLEWSAYGSNLSTASGLKLFFFSGFFGALYVFMNIIQAEPILHECNISLSKKKSAAFSALFATLVCCILFIFVNFASKNLFLADFSMPFLTHFAMRGGAMLVVFSIGLFLALVSGLLSALFAVKHFLVSRIKSPYTLNKSGKSRLKVKYNLLFTALAILLSVGFGFINFDVYISIIYPIIGGVNFVILLFL